MLHNTYIFILIWLCFVLAMSISDIPFIWALYPIYICILLWPYRRELYGLLHSERFVILYQIIFACLYFFYHHQDILRLELWSDEIFSLKISDHPFNQITRIALQLSDIPPLHYWDLWFWQKFIQNSPVHLTEFIYRIPSMLYHTSSSILFAWFISTRRKNTTHIYKYLLNATAFLSFFFNPLLFPFAIEIRPYALMVLGGVISIIAHTSEEHTAIRYIPIQLTLCILSVFNFIYYLPVFISLWFRKIRKPAVLTVLLAILIYMTYVPYTFIPNQANVYIIRTAILRSIQYIQSIFLSNVMQILIAAIIVGFILKRRCSLLLVVQAVTLWIFSIMIGYAIRYQAFAPRHLILSFPIFIYLLYMPIWNLKLRQSILWMTLIFIFYTLPWINRTEYMLQKQLFFPKISIGIKTAVSNALSQQKKIVLERVSVPESDPYYYTYKYMEEISLWYIRRYTHNDPRLFSALTECNTDFSENEYIIRFSTPTCPNRNMNTEILHMRIQE